MENFWNSAELLDIALRMLINLSAAIILIRYIYFNSIKEREFVFTFFLFNIIIFFVSYVMLSADISMGFAFGLFAIFGILRYRTDAIPIKEMTYLLAVIAIALINTLVPIDAISILCNISILFATWTMEKLWFGQNEASKNILFEDISLTHLDNEEELINVLKARTGLDIIRLRIKSLNYLNDSADIKIYYNRDIKK